MRIIFMGTPPFAAKVLERLAASYDIAAVVTRPDAVRSRGKKVESSAVAKLAEELEIPTIKTASLKDPLAFDALKELEPDVICVAAYGAILPPSVLELPRYGCINVHGSLLPRWRGAAPIERALLAGDAVAGVCIMAMEEGLDTGDYCLCAETSTAGKSSKELTEELAVLGGDLLVNALDKLEADELQWTSQDDSLATYAHKLEKGELNLTDEDDARSFERKVLASSEAHPAKMTLAERPLTVLDARQVDDQDAIQILAGATPGQGRFASKRLLLMTREGIVELLELKPDGKKSMDALSFAGGIQGMKGSMFEWGSYE